MKNKASPTAIASESNDVSLFPEIVQFANRVAGMESAGVQLPFFRANESVQGASSTIAGRNVVSFTSFDYLGMAQDDQVTMASKEAIDLF